MDIWQAVGATINLVGSMRTGLLMNSLDIDFHIYSDPFILEDSFKAMARLAENSRFKQITFSNQLETDEKCVEWHARYQDRDKTLWKIDMIHIMAESVDAGYFKKVADRIRDALTPEIKIAILSIKNQLPASEMVPSILVYQAVLRDGVMDLAGFHQWKKDQPSDVVVEWMPGEESC